MSPLLEVFERPRNPDLVALHSKEIWIKVPKIVVLTNLHGSTSRASRQRNLASF